MIRLEKGMLIKTNYGTGPYRIISVKRGCTCPSYLDSINLRDPPDRPEHIHIYLEDPDNKRKSKSFLGGYIEETLTHLDGKDKIEILKSDGPVQGSLF